MCSVSSEGGPGAAGYRRLGGAGSSGGVRRLARGLLLLPSADDHQPLVQHSPSSPDSTNSSNSPDSPDSPRLPSVGYVNEASNDAARAHLVSCRCVTDTSDDNNNSDTDSDSERDSECDSRKNNNNPEEPALLTAAWFQAGLPREVAVEVLSSRPAGSFLVRGSSRGGGGWALSVRAPGGGGPVLHYLLEGGGGWYRLRGGRKVFPSLSALVTHHSVMPECLPCPLLVPR